MMLHNAIQIDEIIVDVVQHFDFRWRSNEEQRCRAREDLDVTGMRREPGDQDIGQTPLAADPRHDRYGHAVLPPSTIHIGLDVA
ncbi:hypothetical protein [Paraburkholderia silvatlantica]|uniref:Uncharacterized protein n=1 Tax=Paraburkholderia silvatlantica TaxID=321895 RepID=A0ABR6FXB1_9BURK|nr:hypothetical protein [Paraburkholderia silvatlantica]